MKIVQKGTLNDYSCGVTQGGYPLIDTGNRAEDSIKENDYLLIGADELSRDPGKRHQGKEKDKMLLEQIQVLSKKLQEVKETNLLEYVNYCLSLISQV